MIAYLPFTYLPNRHLQVLSNSLGCITVISPDPALVPDHMRAAAEQGAVELRFPPGLAEGGMVPAMEAFNQWAELHQDHLVDLAGFIKATRQSAPLVDDTNPSQIRSQIRNRMDGIVDESADPLSQAALYLAMAQAYDQHQEVMREGLGTVHAMERDMLARLSGDGLAGSLPGGADMGPAPAEDDIGGHMTAARVAAWSRLTDAQAQLPLIYLTTSVAVMDHLLDRLPEAQEIARLPLPQSDDGATRASCREALRDLTRVDSDTSRLAAAFGQVANSASSTLTLYRIEGVAPRRMLQRLAPPAKPRPAADLPPEDGGPAVIGRVDLAGRSAI